MKGSCEFYLAAMYEDKNGYLVTGPSTSPENGYKRGLNVDEGTTMELQIIHDLFTNTIAACKTLNMDEAFRTKLEKARAKIRPMKIGKACKIRYGLKLIEIFPEPGKTIILNGDLAAQKN
jgi:alpha-L-fucosidase 2